MEFLRKKKFYSFVLSLMMMLGVFGNLQAAEVETIKINNTELSFNQILYVDVNNGDDTSAAGTKSDPFKTLKKAIDSATVGSCIVLNEGIYNIDEFPSLITSKNITFVGNGGKSTIEINSCKQVRIKGEASFYQIIFQTASSYSGDQRALLYTLDSSNYKLRFYNSAFKVIKGLKTNFPTAWYFIWHQNTATNRDVIFENCSFGKVGDSEFIHGGTQQKYINCAYENQKKVLSGYLCENVTSLYGVTLDEKFNIVSSGWQNIGTGNNPDGSQANIGVYGGPFAWSYTDETKTNDSLIAIASTTDAAITLKWNGVAGATKYIIKRSTTQGDSNSDKIFTTAASSDNTNYIYNDSGLDWDTTYYYTVVPIIDEEEGYPSNEASAKTIKQPVIPPATTGNATLIVTMTNQNVKQYNVDMSVVNNFISWYNNRAAGSSGTPYFVFNKNENLAPYSKKTEYLVFDKISSFEVDEYAQ